MIRTYRIRIGIVSIFALLAMLVLITPGHSQIPPRPGGGIRGGPPGPIGPPTMPGPPGAGIGGGGFGPIVPPAPQMPGAPGGGIGGRPPGIPDFPRPPGIGGRPGIGGPDIYDWSCSGCGRHLGTGPRPPLIRICPGCGARLEGSEIVDGPGVPRRPGGGGAIPPATPPIVPPGPIMPPIGAGPGPEMGGPAVPAFNGGVYVPPSNTPSTTSSTSSGGSVRAMILLITLGVLLLLGIGIGAIVFTILKQQPKPERRLRPRSRRRFDDDDY